MVDDARRNSLTALALRIWPHAKHIEFLHGPRNDDPRSLVIKLNHNYVVMSITGNEYILDAAEAALEVLAQAPHTEAVGDLDALKKAYAEIKEKNLTPQDINPLQSIFENARRLGVSHNTIRTILQHQ